MEIFKNACWVISLISLCGCSSFFEKASEPISIKKGLALVEHDLAQAAPVVLSDVARNPTGFSSAIFNAQCLNGVANPPVPVIVGPIQVALTGSFTTTPSAQVGWNATGPSGQLGFQVAAARTQGLTIPVTFVSASALPDVYLSQSLSYLTGLDPQDEEKISLVKEIVSTRDNILEPIVKDAIQAYPGNIVNCPSSLKDVLVAPVIPYELKIDTQNH